MTWSTTATIQPTENGNAHPPRKGPSNTRRDSEPQPWFLERGFLPVPNIVFTHWLARLENREFVVLLAILHLALNTPETRLRAADAMSVTMTLEQWKQITKLDREAIAHAARGLENKGLLSIRTRRRCPNTYILSLRKLLSPGAVRVGNADLNPFWLNGSVPVEAGKADSNLPVRVGNPWSGNPTPLKEIATEENGCCSWSLSLATANGYFPGTDQLLIENIAKETRTVCPGLTDALLARLLKATYQGSRQNGAGLWLRTVPAYAKAHRDNATLSYCQTCNGSGWTIRPEVDPHDEKWMRKYGLAERSAEGSDAWLEVREPCNCPAGVRKQRHVPPGVPPYNAGSDIGRVDS
ncbi:MAG: hypothetical protein ACRD4Q_12955 [Candidatus Acidiferrales bacterium]